MRPAPRRALVVPVLLSALALSACGAGASAGSAGTADQAVDGATAAGAGAVDGGGLQVVAAFYPLQFLAQEVAGDRAEVTGLTPPGAEPHDLELSPQALAGLTEADLLVVLGGFQPALDDALGSTEAPVLDLAEVADRPYGGSEDAHAEDEHAEDEHAEDEHAEEAHAEETHSDEHSDEHSEEAHAEDEHGHDGSGTDPHFWTDPTRMAEAAGLVADALAEADPDGASTYAANAETLVEELTALDEEAEQALASCEVTTLVTAHDAFGYFADRYGFEVRSINGLSPDQEPDARTQAQIADFVADSGITTVYTETLVSSAVADTVAAEAGVQTAVLDPVEGLTDDSAGQDYREVMRANIDAVRSGQACA